MKNKLVVFLALLLGTVQLSLAQGTAEFNAFQEAAGFQSVLYRGHAALQYSGTLYNGHYYWVTPDFREGSVLFNGKRYSNVLLNVDACDQQLLAKAYEGMMPVAVSRDLVPEFEIAGQKYVNLSLAGQKDASPGFYLVACEEPLIYQRINKILSSSTGDMNGPGIGYDDPNYRYDVFNYFMNDVHYYVLKDGKLKKIGRRKAQRTILAAKER